MSANERPHLLHVCVDLTPGVHRTDGDGVFWWLPVIGPTATVLAHTLVRHTDERGTVWSTTALAQRVGLSGNLSKLWASLSRLERFDLARFHATDLVSVRAQLPALTERQLGRLPENLAAAYPHDQATA